MNRKQGWKAAISSAAVFAVAIAFTWPASTHNEYEVWAIAQSDSPGKTFGGTLYVWDGEDLQQQHGVMRHDEVWDGDLFGFRRRPPDSERLDLGDAAAALCLARTGANPVRPHMIAVNPAQTPNGSHVFMSLRGPIPLTADPHVSTGSTPGIGVLKVRQGARNATFESIVRVSNVMRKDRSGRTSTRRPCGSSVDSEAGRGSRIANRRARAAGRGARAIIAMS